ncbi:hypothetical protein RYZ26_06395 [Terasakiella sp. A23]|uniref:hypothetical protein n=1 Tax=Terasakiella sp. FCG-A23 TaxID=3080561 RepID=UPI0029550D5A|nr:hypothetical protein [Terasakiella sp. A23]MDV7339214.1 hypothetical protein [Terasakiella sp. A23]
MTTMTKPIFFLIFILSWFLVISPAYAETNTSTVNVQEKLISLYLSEIQSESGQHGGQCKSYLQLKLAHVARKAGIKASDGKAIYMPRNDTSIGRNTYQWSGLGNSFQQIDQVVMANFKEATLYKKALSDMLQQIKAGDFLQFVWCPSRSICKKGRETLHTIVFNKDFSDPLNWSDSNGIGKEKVHSGTLYPYTKRKAEKTVSSLINALSKQGCKNCGATLYRLRHDVKN